MLFLFSADIPGIGRMHKDQLSDHQLMEMFFTPDNFAQAREALGGTEDDSCSWNHVTCESGRVTRISWHQPNITVAGSVCTAMLPPALRSLNLYIQPLHGEIDTSDLPRTLEIFCVQSCAFTGTVHLLNLPPKISQFFVISNQISGMTNVENIPGTLRAVRVQEQAVVMKRIRIGRIPERKITFNFIGCTIDEVIYADRADIGRVDLKRKPRKTQQKKRKY